MGVRVPPVGPNLKGNKMKILFEIHAAEGGEDSKLFVADLARAYEKMFSRFG